MKRRKRAFTERARTNSDSRASGSESISSSVGDMSLHVQDEPDGHLDDEHPARRHSEWSSSFFSPSGGTFAESCFCPCLGIFRALTFPPL